ncbi:sulfur carrier protein ThiS [Diaphorobacter ruginosibacter]|uniref:sulfur carrier protein ThiS n=1 Tax=Diaphorobacter ruginosibacter TaxID=1715720 RepID=UPI003340CBB6
MNVTVNQQDIILPDNATVADAVAQVQAKPPFAVAVNMQFVPNTRYAQHLLASGDAIEIISPVTGG